MPSTSRLAQALRSVGLPRSTRAALLRAEIARRVRRRDSYEVPLGPARAYLSDDDYEIDWASLAFVVLDDAYAGVYDDAVVVDIGAHKGYYGAYAFLRGARGRLLRARDGEFRHSQSTRSRSSASRWCRSRRCSPTRSRSRRASA